MNARRQRALCLALLLDLTLGDPPNRVHPVAWMGTAIGAVKRTAPRQGDLAQLAWGAALDVGGILMTVSLCRLLERLTARLPAPWSWLAEAVLLKMTLSLRGLTVAANGVQAALDADDLAEARRLAAWHLVSRDTTTLGVSQVVAATVESVAENTSDGVVAPLLYYNLGGLPACWAYRFINTADSMLGYRDPAHEWLGKAPARLDDLANLLPARLTAVLLLLAAALAGENARRSWRVWRRDRGVTVSPNAGHPMSAMSGALGIKLEKVGHYRLGSGERPPTAEDVGRAVRLMRVTVALVAGLLVGLPVVARLVKRRTSR